MIKTEWITKANGFKEGMLCLYIDKHRTDMSLTFRWNGKTPVITKHPAEGDRDLLKIEGLPANGNGYPVPYFLEQDGDFYPIESQQWQYWNTGCPENGAYQCVKVSDPGWGGRKQVEYFPSLSGICSSGADIVIDRPWWAPGFKL